MDVVKRGERRKCREEEGEATRVIVARGEGASSAAVAIFRHTFYLVGILCQADV